VRLSIVCRHQTMKTTPVIRIDLGSPVPAYRQVANALRALLVAGAFPVGKPLPTVRQLAVDLGVHHNTSADAYRVLAEEGWLDLRRRHGAIVLDRSRPRPSREARPSLVQRLRELTAEAQAAGLAPGVIADSMRVVATELTAGKLKKA
jgi:GntR family transcriptional regulator